jgi:hypothetical protein
MPVTHTRIFTEDLTKINQIRDSSGFRSTAWVLHSLLEVQAKNLATVESIMNERVPVILVGKPLAGKSYFIKNKLLVSLEGSPVLVIDVQNEYENLKKIGFDIFALDFTNFKEHVRFVPNSQSMVSESEIGSLFSNLEMKRDNLSKLTIIVEEGQAFKNIAPLVRFLYGSRHIVRKMVMITPQVDCFQGLTTFTVMR